MLRRAIFKVDGEHALSVVAEKPHTIVTETHGDCLLIRVQGFGKFTLSVQACAPRDKG